MQPVTIVVLTYNAGVSFTKFCAAVTKQTADIADVLVVDSSSQDSTLAVAQKFGFTALTIPKSEFGHGKTRQMALELVRTENVVFMTQDALPVNETSVALLVDYLESDALLGAVYGRQVPYERTGPLGTFARLYNYGEESFVNTLADRTARGIKTAFLSDTFAAYKKSILQKVGGFPKYSSFGEDSCAAAKMLLSGYKTGYCAEAQVYHAHDYSLAEEYKRSRAIKNFHKQESWLLKEFGKPERAGVKFVAQEIKWLLQNGYWYMVPAAFVHNAVKFVGYKI